MHLAVAVLLLKALALTADASQRIEVCGDSDNCESLGSLSSVVTLLQSTNSSHVTIAFDTLELSEAVFFENLSSTLNSISFSGLSINSSITCTHSQCETGSGLYFKRLKNITLSSFTLFNCGIQENLKGSASTFSSGMYIVECYDISLEYITVTNSCGSGLALFENAGVTSIVGSIFSFNQVPEHKRLQLDGGNGVLLRLKNISDSLVVLKMCRFEHNYVTSNMGEKISHFNNGFHLGKGGGLQITILGFSQGNSLSIDRCTFSDNCATYGGGLNIRLYGHIQENNITISGTSIEENFSYAKDGGGVDVGITVVTADYAGSFIRFSKCNFTRNHAKIYGGGISISSSRIIYYDPETNFITFCECAWEENTALAGSAVDVSPNGDQFYINGVFPRPLFINCSFKSNYVKSQTTSIWKEVSMSIAGVGTILNTGFIIQFCGETEISENGGSGIYLSSGTAEFLGGSSTLFQSNIGEKGAAVFVSTFSMILVHDNSTLKFLQNSAAFQGGAIYVHSSDPHEKFDSRFCFIQYNTGDMSTSDPRLKGISFEFQNNTALSSQHSGDVFVQSIEPCSCSKYNGNKMAAFLCLGNVKTNSGLNLLTSADHFEATERYGSILSNVVPGNSYYHVPIMAYDAYNTTRNITYKVYQNDSSTRLKPQFTHITRNRMQFVGILNETTTIKLETEKSLLTFSVKSSMSCPPGYVFDTLSEMCVCGAEEMYGIAFCNSKGAYITQGFWIGHCSDGQVCTSHCPLGFCVYDGSTVITNVHLLPKNFSSLQQFICGPRRKGTLCGTCSENHSVYYHSYRYACHLNKNCKYGILLYIVSELFPLTIMFVLIIVMEIKFTSGHINGFILFAQVLDSISIDANGVISFPITLQVITAIHRFVYRTLNFDFFSLESLSFCFWSTTTALDAMALKYVTVLYAVVLLVLLIIFMNTLRCRRILSCWKPSTIQGSAINGVTAFIVICYSQCARVSFQILSSAYPFGVNRTRQSPVVFRRGEYRMFSPPHLPYAIPALAVLLIMSLIPLLLILYPLIFKILALCKLSESKLAKEITRLFPIPLLDVFQSSFKDNCRFFAGLYFLYRLFALAAYTFAPTLISFYTVVEFLLVFILALHAIVQPYKERWHNVIDSLIFSNLALINSFTLLNYFIVINGSSKNGQLDDSVTAVISLQAILVYLPLVVLLLCLFAFCFKKLKSRLTMDLPSDESLINSMELPLLRTEEVDNKSIKKSF